MVVTPGAELFAFSGVAARRVVVAGDNHAVKTVEKVFTGAAALIAERDGDGVGGGEGRDNAGRPEAAAVPFAAGG